MEILNNLWVAISTPNQMLINIIVSIGIFFEAFLLMTLFTSILNISATKKQKFLYVIIISISSILNLYFIPDPVNLFFNYFVMSISSILIFKISLFKGVLSTICSAVIFALVGTLILNPYLNFFNIRYEQTEKIPIYRFLYLLSMYFATFFISVIIKHRKFKLNLLENFDNKNKRIIFINLLFAIITLIVQVLINTYYIDILPLSITFLSFISLLAYFIISTFSLTRIMKLTITTQKLESAEEYNNTLRILHDSVRSFKHDFDNIVTTIGGYISTDDMDGLKKYYSELEDDCERVNNLYILNPEIINNNGIYNLLTKKYHDAASKDVKITITFLLDLDTLNMKIYEFARILGILLDNAIEASSECEEKIVNITFRNDTKNSTQLLTIENTYADKDVDTEKIFEKGVSGKENHTGLGLWKVRKLTNKYNNVYLSTTKTDKLFKQELQIYY